MQPDDRGGLIEVVLSNTNPFPVSLKVEGSIESVTSVVAKTIMLAQGSSDTVRLAPLVAEAVFASLNEIRPVAYHLSVTALQRASDRVVYSETHPALLLAKDTFIFGDEQPLSFLSCWVTPHAPEIEELVSRAARRYPDGRFVGYQGSPTKDGYRHESGTIDTTAFVAAGSSVRAAWVTIPEFATNCTLTISFLAKGGSTDEIRVAVKDTLGAYLYDYGRAHTGVFTVRNLGPGTYYLILDNGFAWLFGKEVSHSLTCTLNYDVVSPQVKAIYNTLKYDYRMTYVSALISYPVGTQRILFPSDALNRGGANCIDGTVLFASALEYIGLEPILCLVPGHAFVGWRRWSELPSFDFLETTMVGSAEYTDASLRGTAEFVENESAGQLHTVDVADARVSGIFPAMKR